MKNHLFFQSIDSLLEIKDLRLANEKKIVWLKGSCCFNLNDVSFVLVGLLGKIWFNPASLFGLNAI